MLYSRPLIISSAVLVMLATGIPHATLATTTAAFREDFHTTVHRDTKATTAAWDTLERTVMIPSRTSIQRFDGRTGTPAITVTSFQASDRTWLVGGYLLQPPANTVRGQLWRVDDGVWTDLSDALNGYDHLISAIGYNGRTWLIGGSKLFLVYDGTAFTDLSAAYAAKLKSAPTSLTWNGKLWLITGGAKGLGTFDGQTFRSLAAAAKFPTTNGTAAWNKGSQRWLIVYPDGATAKALGQTVKVSAVYTSDGRTVRQIPSPAYLGAISNVASDGRQWLLSGWDQQRQTFTLFLYDGRTFRDISTVMTDRQHVGALDLLWTGKYWLYRTNNSDTLSSMLYRLKRTGVGLAKIPLSIGTQDFWVGESRAVRLIDGWVIAGTMRSTDSSVLLLRGTEIHRRSAVVQSKTVVRSPRPIISAQLNATATLLKSTAITYRVSNNGGRTWVNAPVGTTVAFPTAGTDLQWQATLSTTNTGLTPVLKRVVLSYTTR